MNQTCLTALHSAILLELIINGSIWFTSSVSCMLPKTKTSN